MTEGVFLLGTERDGTQAIARFRTPSGAKTACGALTAGERRQTVENRSFPRFFHTKKRRSRSVENSGLLFFQSGEGPNRQPERTVKRKENPSTFFYIKGKVPTFLPRNWHESPGCITACISKTRFPCGKPGGKSGKPRGKLGLFFTKSVENPVEKVKSSLRNGKTPPFFVVKWAGVWLHFAVTA